jgi:hypothetical protein
MTIILNWLTVVTSIAAAALWFSSALVKIPNVVTGTYGGGGDTAHLLPPALRRQSRLSAYGALCAAIAAASQALALLSTAVAR